MTLYEKNVKTLTKYYPEMDKLLQDARKETEGQIAVMEEQSYDGETILKIKKEGRTVYLNGKRNAKEPARIWVDTLGELKTNAPILMVGVGNPGYLKELVEQTKNRLAIFVYEPSLQIFLKFLEMEDLERWMEKHLIVFWVKGLEDMDPEHMRGILDQVLAYEMLNYSRVFVLPNYQVLFPDETIEFMKMCRDISLKESSQYWTQQIFSNVLVKNLLRNARHLYKGYKTTQLAEVIPSNLPGIVVAAGPSLNKNIEDLRAAKGRAFIIAVDTAIKPLVKAGIYPDMFAIIDAVKPVELVQMEEAKEIPLLTTLNAASEVLDYHTGMKFFFNEGYQFAERIFLRSGMKVGDVSCGGSVATSAFSLLYKLGLNTIILVGQDLAYTNNRTHADGTFKEVMEEIDVRNRRMVEGNYEEKVPTGEDLKIFIDWYNFYIRGCKEHSESFKVINATEGGAKIENTEIMTLKDAIEQECKIEVDLQKKFRELPPMLGEEQQKWAEHYLASMPEDFHKLAVELRKIKGSYKKLDRICNKKKIDQKEYLHILHKLKKQITEVEKKSVYQLVSITMSNAGAILRNEQFLQKESVKKEGKEIARKGILFMENAAELADVFSEFAEEIYRELEKTEEM